MKTGLGAEGFTIFEMMIVLGITVALIAAALIFINGKQQATEFNQSITDMQSQVNQIIGNIETGYYAKTTDFTCATGPTAPDITPGATSQGIGTNKGCIFIGRAIQFTNTPAFNVYDLVGLQYMSGTTFSDVTQVSGPSGTEPTVLPNNIEADNLEYGLLPIAMKYSIDNNPPNINTGIAAIVSNFGSVINGGNELANLYYIDTTTLNGTTPGNAQGLATTAINAPDGANFKLATAVSMCFDGSTDKYGILTIGSNNRQLASTLQIVTKGASPPAECMP